MALREHKKTCSYLHLQNIVLFYKCNKAILNENYKQQNPVVSKSRTTFGTSKHFKDKANIGTRIANNYLSLRDVKCNCVLFL